MACYLPPSSTCARNRGKLTADYADGRRSENCTRIRYSATTRANTGEKQETCTTEGTRYGGQAEGTQRTRPNYHNVEQKWAFILSSSCHLESTGLRYRRMGERREDGSSLRLWLGPG